MNKLPTAAIVAPFSHRYIQDQVHVKVRVLITPAGMRTIPKQQPTSDLPLESKTHKAHLGVRQGNVIRSRTLIAYSKIPSSVPTYLQKSPSARQRARLHIKDLQSSAIRTESDARRSQPAVGEQVGTKSLVASPARQKLIPPGSVPNVRLMRGACQ